MNDLPFRSATELLQAIREKRIGSAELLEVYVERYERLNPRLNAIVATGFEDARERARQADLALSKGESWGPLHGLPMTIKDCIEVVGMRSTWGTPLLKDYVSTRNADVVQPLLDAGAIVFGKTNIPLFAMDTQTFNEVYGQTNNPWDVARSPGGSSGGSAAALAAGLTALEIGSDIGGSIRSPAHFCGVYGHKPTYGIVPMYGQLPPLERYTIDYAVEMDIVVTGPLARSAEDLGLVMDLVVQPARPQRKAVRIELPAPRKERLSDYRIGLWIDDPLFPPDTDTGDRLQDMVDRLASAGARLEERKPDIDFPHCLEVYFALLTLATLYTMPADEFDRVVQASRALADDDHSPAAYLARTSTKLHRDWQLLNIERSLMRQKWDDYFREVDVLLCPAVRVPALPHDHTDIQKRIIPFEDRALSHAEVLMPWAGLTIVSYLPATVAPIGSTPSGLPVGVQIVGPYLEDRTPIHLARLMEDVVGGFVPPSGFE
jgi:amidase